MTRNPWQVLVAILAGAFALIVVITLASRALSSTRRTLGMEPVATVKGDLVEKHQQAMTIPQRVVATVAQPFRTAPADKPYVQPMPCEVCRLKEERWLRRLASDGHFYPTQGQMMEIPRR